MSKIIRKANGLHTPLWSGLHTGLWSPFSGSALAGVGEVQGGGGGGSDPDFASVVALLHFDGSNGSGVFTDEIGHTFTTTGTPTISTTQSVFGGTSGSFPAGNSLISSSSTDFSIGTGDFTLECWVRFATASWCDILSIENATTGTNLHLWKNATENIRVGLGGDAKTQAVSLNTWYHVALSRTGSTMRAFLNGVQMGANMTNAGTMSGNTTIIIGYNGNAVGAGLGGFIDDFRLTIGVGRYTAGFSVPADAYPDS